MELALLVYAISLITSIGTVAGAVTVIGLIVLGISTIHYLDYHTNKIFWLKVVKNTTLTLVFSILILVLLPSEKTAYTMVGAYAAQKVAEDPKVQQLSGKVLVLLEKKLDGYIAETVK